MIKFMMRRLLFSQEVVGKGNDSSWGVGGGLDGAAVKGPGSLHPLLSQTQVKIRIQHLVLEADVCQQRVDSCVRAWARGWAHGCVRGCICFCMEALLLTQCLPILLAL